MAVMKILYIFSVVSSYYLIEVAQSKYLDENYPKTVREDSHLDTAQLIHKYKYPIETHFVTTEDHYILCLHRIPKPKAPPVLLMHGLLDSSATWILMGPDKSLGYYLYDNGYDVWLGNSRGNRYSRNHTTFKPDSDMEFWQFDWHEIGIYDLRAIIDYILSVSDFKKLSYFGHSQGTTAFWILCSLHPTYNEKINIMLALAPVAFMKHIKTPLINYFREFVKASEGRIFEFLPHTELMFQMCFTSKLSESICVEIFKQMLGNDGGQTNATMYPVMIGHVPAGCNFKQFVHYLQLQQSDRFCQYDYGHQENMNRYGHAIPPDYSLNKVKVPVALFYCLNDNLSTDVDVKRLAKILPNVVENILYPYEKWNHITPLWGLDARRLAHGRMLELLREYSLK